MKTFKMIDTSTGKEITSKKVFEIVKESGLLEMDIDEFYIGEDGRLILADDCGNMTSCDMEKLGLMPVFTGKYPDLECLESVFLGYMHSIYPEAFKTSFWMPQAELVAMFPQVWSNTAGGFSEPGMVAGQAFTTQITTVLKVSVHDAEEEYYGVFFDNEPAYIVDNANDVFFDDLKNRRIRSRYDAKKVY